ncbi:hypothetical protein GQ42DRAFT_38705 [Ramicandelaber brevisporus]|nr:hypothetical protein GQ42DRAFT_38705 [Ramicandelaber brevisporus]
MTVEAETRKRAGSPSADGVDVAAAETTIAAKTVADIKRARTEAEEAGVDDEKISQAAVAGVDVDEDELAGDIVEGKRKRSAVNGKDADKTEQLLAKYANGGLDDEEDEEEDDEEFDPSAPINDGEEDEENSEGDNEDDDDDEDYQGDDGDDGGDEDFAHDEDDE